VSRPPGTLIAGRYRIQGFLGRGTFGEVYAVHDAHQGVARALKFLNRTPGGSGVWQEAVILTALRSDYILPVWNADFEAGVPFLVTELAVNGSASHRMPAHGLTPAQSVRWIRSASRGAARTHDAGLVHRDIKPDNVFINSTDEALLGDFGLAHAMDASGQAPYGGTPVTMAPEVIVGGPTSVQSDVYSLGATLFRFLSGVFPVEHPDPAQLAALVVAGKLTSLRDVAPHVGKALDQRVKRALSLDPSRRYSSAAEFDAALGELPTSDRHWARTDEHVGPHLACWRVAGGGKGDATVCVNAVGSRFEVIAAHQPSGRRITAACRAAAPQSTIARNVRAAIAAAS
jgi:serine/threonine protein kinase